MQGSREGSHRLLSISDSDDRLAADSLDFAAADSIVLVVFNVLKIGGNDLKFQAGTSGIQDEDVHHGVSGVGLPSKISPAFAASNFEGLSRDKSFVDRHADYCVHADSV